MQLQADSAEHYIQQLPADRQEAMSKLRKVILDHLPDGFEETTSYGMITYVVPHTFYPPGYHVNPKQALPFLSIASQKNFIALYHMGIYGSPQLLNWFTGEYPKHCKTRLDMGKSCIRFKKPAEIPYQLIAELVAKISPAEWVRIYEMNMEKMKKGE